MMKSFAVVAAVAAALVAGQAQAADGPLRWGAGKQSSQNYTVNGTLVSALSKEGVEARLQSYGGDGVFLPMINAGRLDFAATPSAGPREAYLGLESFGGVKNDKLRLAGIVMSYATGIMVRADSGIKTMADLKGKRIAYGYTTQPTLKANVQGMLATGGVGIDDVETVLVPTVPAGVAELISGKVDAALFALRGGKAVEADAQLGGIRFLPVANTPENQKTVREYMPTAFIADVKPSKGQPGIAEVTPSVHFDYVLVTSADVPVDTVYKIVEALDKQGDEIRSHRITDSFSTDRLRPHDLGVPVHEGAEKYFKEHGID